MKSHMIISIAQDAINSIIKIKTSN